MLHPSDQAFLAATVRLGAVPADQASAIALRYQGAAGGLGNALVQSGVITPHLRDQIHTNLQIPDTQRFPHEMDASGTARIGAPREDTRQFGNARPASGRFGLPLPTPTSARFPAGNQPPSSGSQRSSSRIQLPGRTPEIPGYTLTKELGRGGMGAVYQATRNADSQVVAIKLLHNAGERQIARFEREAQAMERLRHPNVVPLLETGNVNGKPYIVLAYIEGGDLHEALERGDLDRDDALRIIAKVARAIAHAHTLDILHRDLKPANILLDARNEPRVTDFGLAKILDRETQLTKTHATLGTPHYMAPEQVTGEKYTPAVDTYALGVILYQIVTHELPFQESGIALFRQIREDRPQRPWDVTDVDKDLGRLILWALEKAPADRPRCIELATAIESYLGGEEMEVRRASLRERAKPLLIGGGAVLLLLSVALGGLGVARWRANAARVAAEDQAIQAIQNALGEARRARKGNDLDGLLAEAAAHRKVVELLAAVPDARRAEAEGKLEAAKARERRSEVLRLAVPLLIAAERGEEAITLAREYAALSSGRPAELILARAEATDPATAAQAFRRVEALIAQRSQLPSALRSELAATLLQLQRPKLAALVLEQAGPEQLALRGRARLAHGDLTGARADLLEALQSVGRDVEVSILLATVEGRLGKPDLGLMQLDKLKAGSNASWHGARAELLSLLGRPGAAKRAYEQAFTIAAQEGPLQVRLKRARGRFHLHRGRRFQAEAELAGATDPAARLDLALSQWIGGGPDASAQAVLEEISQGVDRLTSSPALSAIAARWLARLWIAAGDPSAAKRAAERAWSLEPSAESAETRAWVAFRAGDTAAARVALAASPAPASHAELQIRLAIAAKDLARVRTLLDAFRAGPDDPSLALLRLLATPVGDSRRRVLAERAYRLQQRGPLVRVVSVPQASHEPKRPRYVLIERLHYEARRLRARVLGRHDPPSQALVETILRRVIGLEPDHFSARLTLAQISEQVGPLLPVIARAPTLADARRIRINVARAQRRRDGQSGPDPATFEGDIAVLLKSTGLAHSERVSFSLLLDRRGKAGQAWAVLEPALRVKKHRILAAFQQGARLAKRLGKTAEGERCDSIVAEIKETIRDALPLMKTAFVGEDITDLTSAQRAMGRIERDLPRTAYAHRLKAQLQFGRGRWALGVMEGGDYIALARGLGASKPSMWLYGFAWAEQTPQQLIATMSRERSDARPREAGPWLTQALHYGARFYLKKPRDPDDIELAADRALRALHLNPRSPGAAALAANLLISAKDILEAVKLIDLALAIDPQCKFAVMQQARLAAHRNQPAEAIGYLRDMRYTNTLKRQLAEDPSFDPIREHPDVIALFQEKGVPIKKK